MSTDDPDEPRVKDMDPATIAQLASWFDRPSYEALEEQQAAKPPAEPTDAEKIQARRREVLAHVDPALLAHVEQHRSDAESFRKVHPPDRPWHEGHRITLFDDAAVPPPFDPYDVREVDIPASLTRDLKTCTPQAFLRDLYRPEKEFWVQLRSPWEDDDQEPVPADPMAPIRALIAQDYRPPTVPRAAVSIAASIADLKGLLARPWQEAKRGPARAREAELLGQGQGKVAAGGSVPGVPEGAP